MSSDPRARLSRTRCVPARLLTVRRGRPRSPRLLAAVTLALVPALLVPAAALAVRAAGTPGAAVARLGEGEGGVQGGGRGAACQLQIELASARLHAGEAATIVGTLTCDGVQASEQTVSIYDHQRGTPGSSVIGTVTPEAGGAFHFTTEALEADRSFYARAEGAARSARVSVQVTPLVTIVGSAEGPQLASVGGHAASDRAGRTVTFTGTVTPAEAGARVQLEREGANEGNWHVLAVGHVGAEGSYSITHTFGIPGSVEVRVVAHVHGHPPAISETLSYSIARGAHAPQADGKRPTLTATVSAASVVEGETVKFTGTLTPAAGQVVDLELEGADGLGFHLLASTTVGSEGSFSIEQTLTTVGTHVFRLAVRPRAGLQAVTSQPLQVQVTGAS
jgi:hypothetical protein